MLHTTQRGYPSTIAFGDGPPPLAGEDLMSRESTFIDLLRSLATAPGARGLRDDAALLEIGGTHLVLTKDLLVEGIHYRPDDPPEDVAWKLLAVNLSDLAAKGAHPVAVLLGYTLGDSAWDRAFADGLRQGLHSFGVPLIGGDTVAGPPGAPRTLSLTAIGEARRPAPSREGARPGDILWVSGTIGDAGAGLAMLGGELAPDEALVRRYRRPRPRMDAGLALAPLVSAIMDVSDGLLIDALRMAGASGARFSIELDHIPLSQAYIASLGDSREARLRAVTSGDDYELLFTAPEIVGVAIVGLSEEFGVPLSRIGRVEPGDGLALADADGPVPLPPRLGYEHGAG